MGGALPRPCSRRRAASRHPVDRGPLPVRPPRPVAAERAQLRGLLPRPGPPRRSLRSSPSSRPSSSRGSSATRRGSPRRSRSSRAGRLGRRRPGQLLAARGARARVAAQARRAAPVRRRAPRSSSASALFPWRARPGVAIEIVRARRRGGPRATSRRRDRARATCSSYLARTTGLSSRLISLDEPLDAADVEAAFAARVIGQPVATRAAADVILKVRAGLADPRRPVSVTAVHRPDRHRQDRARERDRRVPLRRPVAARARRHGRAVRARRGGAADRRPLAARDGLLTSRVRAQPFCVVLLDEIEKAHPQALHLLLQLFDEGRLTDAAGEVASFASAVVIMTSNLGARNARADRLRRDARPPSSPTSRARCASSSRSSCSTASTRSCRSRR